jgi:hypothetical protein
MIYDEVFCSVNKSIEKKTGNKKGIEAKKPALNRGVNRWLSISRHAEAGSHRTGHPVEAS